GPVHAVPGRARAATPPGRSWRAGPGPEAAAPPLSRSPTAVPWPSRQRPEPPAGKGGLDRGRPHGGHHLTRQAARDRLPVIRDLRRAAFVLGLRPPRGRAQAPRQERLVAADGAAPR